MITIELLLTDVLTLRLLLERVASELDHPSKCYEGLYKLWADLGRAADLSIFRSVFDEICLGE